MSASGKPTGLLTGLPNPATKRPIATPIVVSPEAEEAFGLSPSAQSTPTLPTKEPALPPQILTDERIHQAADPEKSKTFFLPYTVCQRLEMQKISERREMKHIVRQALEEYFDRNPLRQSVQALYEDT